MLKNHYGFSLVELVVVMAIFVIVIAVTGDAFNRILSRATQQSRTVESNIEGVIGLEIMRKDIASAGFGLPWSFSGTINYQEAAGTGIAASYNDASSGIPRAICGGGISTVPSGTTYIQNSDYLVIKATSVGMSPTAQRWTYMNYTGALKPTNVKPSRWPSENLVNGNRVIVIRVALTSTYTKELLVPGGSCYTQFNQNGLAAAFEPTETNVAHYIYGVTPDKDLRMPFNRADYYVRVPAAGDLPARCATNTGVLFKAVVSHDNGTLEEFPLLDCVADMQVVYLLDSTGSGSITETSDLSTLTADQIRERLKAVKVFILTHDGGRDRSYSYPNATIDVGPPGTGRTFALSAIQDYRNYRWKVYHMTVRPENVNIVTQ